MRPHHGNFKITEKVSFETLKNDVKGLWRLVKGRRHIIVLIVALMALIRSLDSLANYLFKIVVDKGVDAGHAGIWTHDLVFWGTIFGILLLLNKTVFSFIQELITQITLTRIENSYPVIAHKKSMALSVAYHSQNNTGEKISKIEKGYQNLSQALGDLFKMLLPQCAFFLFNLGIIAYISWTIHDWWLTILVAVPIIPTAIMNYRIYTRFGPVWNALEAKKEERSGIFGQSVYYIKLIKQSVQSQVANFKIEELSREITEINIGVIVRVQVAYLVIVGFFYSFLLWSCYYATDKVVHQQLMMGTVVFIFMTGNSMFRSLWMMVHIYIRFLQNLAAIRRVGAILEAKPEIKSRPRAVAPAPLRGAISFVDAGFDYAASNDTDRRPLFDGLDMDIRAGKKTAIVGVTGAGKTTILNLISRFYDVRQGAILYDGTDIRDLKIDGYNHLFATVYQEPAIFDTTIKENVCFPCRSVGEGKEIFMNATDEEIEEALVRAGLAEVFAFEKGVDTKVGEGGKNLSGGQRQRLELARAILTIEKGASILLLDEPTSQLDAGTEAIIQKAINDLRQKKELTIIVVAHRLATVKDADKIIVIDKGRVAEEGTHENLMARGGLYSKFVNLQKIIK